MAWFMTWAVECIVKLFIGLKNNMKTKTRGENAYFISVYVQTLRCQLDSQVEICNRSWIFGSNLRRKN